jgi:DNA repair protein RadC
MQALRQINSFEETIEFLKENTNTITNENSVNLILLNSNNQVLSIIELSEISSKGPRLNPKNIIKLVIINNSNSFILLQNSKLDHICPNFTADLIRLSNSLNIRFLDYIAKDKEYYYSLFMVKRM